MDVFAQGASTRPYSMRRTMWRSTSRIFFLDRCAHMQRHLRAQENLRIDAVAENASRAA
jgi:hypothetical protein